MSLASATAAFRSSLSWYSFAMLAAALWAIAGGISFWNGFVVQEVRTGGQVLNVQHHPGTIGPGNTKVETTEGFFMIEGFLQLRKGAVVTVQTRANARKYLCAGEDCKRLTD